MTSTEVSAPLMFRYLTNEELEVQRIKDEAKRGKFFAERCRRHYCEIQETVKEWERHGTNYMGSFPSLLGTNPRPQPTEGTVEELQKYYHVPTCLVLGYPQSCFIHSGAIGH